MDRQNWLWAEEFLVFIKKTRNLQDSSLGRYRSYLKHLLKWANDVSFVNADQIHMTFIEYLESQWSAKTGEPLAYETWKKVIGITTQFFNWAKHYHPRFFANLSPDWIYSLQIPSNVYPNSEQEIVSLDEINLIYGYGMANKGNLILFRDCAAAITLFLSGMRASAFVSLPIKAISKGLTEIRQFPELGVRTKNRKRATTYLLQISHLLKFAQEWDQLVRNQLPPHAMWFSVCNNQWGEITLTANMPGKNRNQLLNRRLKKIFQAVGLPYKSAHKFRHGFSRWALARTSNYMERKAVSQNMMHASTHVTDKMYGSFPDHQRAEIMAAISSKESDFGSSDTPIINRASEPVSTGNIDLSDSSIVFDHVERLMPQDSLQRQHIAARPQV
jgi:integrase